MNANKTQPTNRSVQDYIESIANEERKQDAKELLGIMQSVTGAKPVLWGPSIVGFGSYHYVYATGREGDAPKVAFSARKQALTIYGIVFYDTNEEENARLLAKLGPHKTGKGCLYIPSLNTIDTTVLKRMIASAYSHK